MKIRPAYLLGYISILLLPFSASANPVLDSTDISGDGIGELGVYDPSGPYYHVRVYDSSTGVSYNTVTPPSAPVGAVNTSGDFDGDGKADLASFERSLANWHIKYGNGTEAIKTMGTYGDIPVPAKYRGLSCTDLATFNARTAEWDLADCDGTKLSTETFGDIDSIPVPADFDCDGKVDLATFNRATRTWKWKSSLNSTSHEFTCGLPSDIPIPGNYVGNSCDEVAIYRPTTNYYFVASGFADGVECTGLTAKQWGLNNDLYAAVSVDSDDKLDYGVFRPSTNTYYLETSVDSDIKFTVPFDTTGTTLSRDNVPLMLTDDRIKKQKVKGDYNRDGISDIGWVSRGTSSTTWVVDYGFDPVAGTHRGGRTHRFGRNASALVPGDYDGDGRTQAAIVTVLSNGTLEWQIVESNNTISTYIFGTNGGKPHAGDLDCDGRDDIVVSYNDSTTNGVKWDVMFSSNKVVSTNHQFGLSGDTRFVADMNADGCDDVVIARRNAGTANRIYWAWHDFLADDGLSQNPNTTYNLTQWGGENDAVLKPADVNGDGRADFLTIRQEGTQMTLRARTSHAGQAFVNGTETDSFAGDDEDSVLARNNNDPYGNFGEFFIRNWGLTGDIPIPGDFSGIGRFEFAVFRPSQRWLYIFRHYLSGTVHGVLNSTFNTLVMPSGQVVPNVTSFAFSSTFDGAPTPPPTTTPPAETVGCTATAGTDTDFVDGNEGALWKPDSDAGKLAVLMPRGYCEGFSTSSTPGLRITVLGKDGIKRSGIERSHCKGSNGNRPHWFLDTDERVLDRYKPLTVKVERTNRGITECRTVPEPTRRYD